MKDVKWLWNISACLNSLTSICTVIKHKPQFLKLLFRNWKHIGYIYFLIMSEFVGILFDIFVIMRK